MNYFEEPYKKPFQYIGELPIRVLSKRGSAVNVRFGESTQLGFIPASCFDSNGRIITDLTWWKTKQQNQHKINLMVREEYFGG